MSETTSETRIERFRREYGISWDERFRPLIVWLLLAILGILAVWALRAAAAVVVPFVAALFIALAVAPVDFRIRKAVPERLKWLGHVAAMALVVFILAVFFVGIYLAAQQAVQQLPDLSQKLSTALPGAASADTASTTGGTAAGAGEGPADAGDADERGGNAGLSSNLTGLLGDLGGGGRALLERTVAYFAENAQAFGQAILSAAAGLIGGLVLVFFLVLLMLVEGPTWRDKAQNALSSESRKGWEDSFAVMAASFRWYLLVRSFLGAITATLYVGWLAVFDVGLLIVWGVLAFLLNFIPTLGSIIAGAIPIVYVLVTQDWQTALFAAIGIIVIEQVMGNYVDPRVQGKQLSVSPLVTFFALILFGWMWGVIGALLAVPLAVFIVIACAHTPGMRSIGLLLSDCRDMDCLMDMTNRR